MRYIIDDFATAELVIELIDGLTTPLERNRYYGPSLGTASNLDSFSVTTPGDIVYMRFYNPRDIVVNRIACEVTTAQPGASCRMGIFEASSSLKPGSRLYDSGDQDASVTGKIEVNMKTPLERGWIWLAITCDDAAVVFRGIQQEYVQGALGHPVDDASLGGYHSHRIQSQAYAALPGTASAGSTVEGVFPLVMIARVSVASRPLVRRRFLRAV